SSASAATRPSDTNTAAASNSSTSRTDGTPAPGATTNAPGPRDRNGRNANGTSELNRSSTHSTETSPPTGSGSGYSRAHDDSTCRPELHQPHSQHTRTRSNNERDRAPPQERPERERHLRAKRVIDPLDGDLTADRLRQRIQPRPRRQHLRPPAVTAARSD